MSTTQVLAIEVGCVAVAVPPGPSIEGGTVVLRVVAVPVLGGEPHAAVLQKGVTCMAHTEVTQVSEHHPPTMQT